jgi:hypothetical protein
MTRAAQPCPSRPSSLPSTAAGERAQTYRVATKRARKDGVARNTCSAAGVRATVQRTRRTDDARSLTLLISTMVARVKLIDCAGGTRGQGDEEAHTHGWSYAGFELSRWGSSHRVHNPTIRRRALPNPPHLRHVEVVSCEGGAHGQRHGDVSWCSC